MRTSSRPTGKFTPMKADYVSDTMAVILHLERRKRPSTVKAIFEKIEQGHCTLAIPAMAVAELGYLCERRRIDTNLAELMRYIQQHSNCWIAPLTGKVVEQAFRIGDIPELHDRLIAATAITLDAPLITNDPIITASPQVTTLWSDMAISNSSNSSLLTNR